MIDERYEEVSMQINWECFSTYNHDSRGIRFKFEDLCRQLFINEFIKDNKQYKYLHANPNNHGLETEPIYDEVNDRWIGFQAKFFDTVVKYDQIMHSAQKTVEYYTGKDGIVNCVYLFCNKPITATSHGYVNCVKYLSNYEIEIQLITDTAILDLVRAKYPYLGLYYFGNHTLNNKWFEIHNNHMFDELQERYNKEFDVETLFSDELSLFINDSKAVNLINAKKKALLDKIEKKQYVTSNKEYLQLLFYRVSLLDDVDIENLEDSFGWFERISEEISQSISKLNGELEELENKQFDENDIMSISDFTVQNKIREIKELIDLPRDLIISDKERKLIMRDCLFVHGIAGIGKSHLLATKTNTLLSEGRSALLLVAGIYFTNDPIDEQIMKNLHLNYSFDELVDILEAIGEKQNRIVPVFIDALNETWNANLWKSGISSILDKIHESRMVKIVVSYRSEYEKILLPECVRNDKINAVSIHHLGFEFNSIQAIREFLNHYNIPFTPTEYFGSEMSNPLFLTLYCKTYNGNNGSLQELYERLIGEANRKIYHNLKKSLQDKGYTEEDELVSELVVQIADWFIINNKKTISQKELLLLNFWGDYDISAIPFVRQLQKERLLYESIYSESKRLHFAYDQMNDYFCAKAIISRTKDRAEVIAYIKADVLNIVNGKLNNPENVDLFVNICALYAEKYGEECIEIIDAIDNDNDKYFIFSRYLTSFEWRNKENLPVNQFNNWLMKNQLYEKAVWRMLISNSMKVNHPFNADYLHELLYKFSLNKRDYVWTIYINELKSYNNDNRLIQLIEMYASGQKLDISDDKQIELMLTLFGWLLTSSNRKLRDYTSKAMIEILKDRVGLCRRVLEKFHEVNDPYILQRLYGIVFVACCRRLDEENIQDLAEYVYYTIFDNDMVYPDILLRDYARMIIERFLYENPEYTGIIQKIKIIPPYNSEPIPEINDQHYLDKHYEGGMYRLISSMKFEGMGIYGDFGRYVFQGAIKTFDINESKVWNYAVSYILNDLGYSVDLFGEYDLHCSSGRNETIKTERIGKKYQWIMMYNILARIADHCQMLDRWSSDNNNLVYDGAWQLYVRNFDPTLICNNIKYDDMPVFEALKSCSINAKYEHSKVNVDSEQMKSDWMNTKGIFFDEMKNMMILSDEYDTKWISLTRYFDTGRKMIDRDRLYEWSWAYAYFVSIGQAEQLVNCITNNRPVITNATASFHQETNVYNREYPWAPSYKCSEQYAEVEVDIETGEEEIITENIPVHNYSKFMQFITKYSGEDGEESDGTITIPNITYENKTVTRKVRKKIGNILHATTDLLWECQYDATIDETVTRSMPCAKIINTMHLKQLDREGFFYNSNHEIVAFDTNLTQDVNAVVIRKDVLDEFLAKTNMKLIWIMDAEKEVDRQSHDMVKWSEWEGVFVYEGDFVSGEFKRLK